MRQSVLMLIILIFSMPSSAEEVEEKISEEMGYKLTAMAIGNKSERITGTLKNTTPFLIYQTLERNKHAMGWYAVNRWTGDVWDINGNCKHLISPSLRKEQEKIKTQFSKKELEEYKHLNGLQPYRIHDFRPCNSPD